MKYSFLFVFLCWNNLSTAQPTDVKAPIFIPGLLESTNANDTVEVIYYPFYDGVQMIELDYNAFESRRLRRLPPRSSIWPSYYSINAIILRNKSGVILAQYNTNQKNKTKSFYTPLDFIPPDQVGQLHFHRRPAARYIEDVLTFDAYRYLVSTGGKWGIIDTFGKAVLPVIYDQIIGWDKDFVPVSQTFYGMRNEKMACYTMALHGKWGFYSDSISIPPLYNELVPLKYNVLKVKNTAAGLIDYKQHMLVDTLYQDITYRKDFFVYTALNKVVEGDVAAQYGIINSRFRIVTGPVYLSVNEVNKFEGRPKLYWACKGDGCGFVSSLGRALSAFRYSDEPRFNWWGKEKYVEVMVRGVKPHRTVLNSSFKDLGIAYDEVYGWTNQLLLAVKDGKQGLMNLTGKEVLSCRYDLIDQLVEGFAKVKRGDSIGVINEEGKLILPCRYVDVNIDPSVHRMAVFKNNETVSGHSEFDGRYKVALFNTDGTKLTAFDYDEIRLNFYYEPRLATARKGDNWGLLDTTGRERCSFRYLILGELVEGRRRMRRETDWGTWGWGYMDAYGREVIPTLYDNAKDFHYNEVKKMVTAEVEQNGKTFLIDQNGKKVE